MKVSKETVNYRLADGERRCGNCIMFHARPSPPQIGTCDLVTGRIRTVDVCDRWEEK